MIGLGLIGGSLCLALREHCPDSVVTGWDRDAVTRATARRRGFGLIAETLEEAVEDVDLVILGVPVGAIAAVAASLAPTLPANSIVSDVASVKGPVTAALAAALPHVIVPAHPIAGTERSGPDAAFPSLFRNRWCVLTPPPGTPPTAIARVAALWKSIGARVAQMTPERHDQVLAVTSHLPHLIAYTIVGTASQLEQVERTEVIKYSAGGFRDFTRIAASDPTMWRDVFLANRGAVLAMLDRFGDDLARLRAAINAGDGATLYEWFARTRAIRRAIVDEGQDDPRPDFGRADH